MHFQTAACDSVHLSGTHYSKASINVMLPCFTCACRGKEKVPRMKHSCTSRLSFNSPLLPLLDFHRGQRPSHTGKLEGERERQYSDAAVLRKLARLVFFITKEPEGENISQSSAKYIRYRTTGLWLMLI